MSFRRSGMDGDFNEQKQKAFHIQAQINQTDREIDQLVYNLYGLDADEIKIIEESVRD